ncbi:MAG: hypothetical protein ACO1OB_15170 [Archangium sp.]
MERPSTQNDVNVEILKLLLQVAWADDVLDPKERETVASLGPKWGIAAEVMDTLLKHLDTGKPLPQPNMGLLRQHRAEVVAAAQWFIGVDGVIEASEKDFVTTVKDLLG